MHILTYISKNNKQILITF